MLVGSIYLLGTSLSSKGAANATMMGDEDCRTTESGRGMSRKEGYNKKMDVKLHKPRTTTIAYLSTR